jgi:hypothetical protein
VWCGRAKVHQQYQSVLTVQTERLHAWHNINDHESAWLHAGVCSQHSAWHIQS